MLYEVFVFCFVFCFFFFLAFWTSASSKRSYDNSIKHCMQTDNTARKTQRTPSNCHGCQDVVRFLCVVLKALNQLTFFLSRVISCLILHVHIHSTQLHDMLAFFSMLGLLPGMLLLHYLFVSFLQPTVVIPT